MSRENVKWIERFWDLYNGREIDAWVEMMAPDLEWHVDPEDPDTTVHRGPEAVTFKGHSKIGGVPVEQRAAELMTVRAGKVVRTEHYSSTEEALKAVALEE